MCSANNNNKWKETNNGRNRIAKSMKTQNAWTKGNLQVLGKSESGHHQTSGDEGKNKKRISQMNEKTSLNKTLQQESHLRDKHLDGLPCKILRIILELDEGRTQTNGPETRKLMIMH